MYKITFINIKTGLREVYLNNTGFEELWRVKDEIRLLEEQQGKYESMGHDRTRRDFRHERIKIK